MYKLKNYNKTKNNIIKNKKNYKKMTKNNL